MKVKYLLISSFIILIFLGCKINIRNKKLKNGDLIFVESNENNLSGAISRVTKNKQNTISYDHIGVVERRKNKIYVLHATTNGGSKKQDIQSFIQSHQDRKLVVYRLKNKYKSAIPLALVKANQMLGKPYNFSYILNDSTYYCSDFIQRAFSHQKIFKLEPMTFKNPKTGEIDDYWEGFYKNQNLEILEGKLGCNPNGISKSNKIYKAFILQKSLR